MAGDKKREAGKALRRERPDYQSPRKTFIPLLDAFL